MKSGKSRMKSLFGPLQRKTFAAALFQFFEEQCLQMGGQLGICWLKISSS